MQKFDETCGPEQNREHVGDPSPSSCGPNPGTAQIPSSLTLRLLRTALCHNASSTDTQGTALLGDLETHSLNCSTCEIRFLQPWAQQGLTPKQWQDLELLIHRSLSDFFRLVNKVPVPPPFVTQFSSGCELPPNGSSTQFCDAGMNGEDVVSFDADAGAWLAGRGDKLALEAWDRLSRDRGMTTTLQFLLSTMCVNGIKSFVQHGKESVERHGEAGPQRLPQPGPPRRYCWFAGVTMLVLAGPN
uniref:MHC class I-like antigen recognition-like domain-containing protein n=1 Tax=Terrapene triunguis TaxID=2587831 RepID=A0A674JWP8_9SAUR